MNELIGGSSLTQGILFIWLHCNFRDLEFCLPELDCMKLLYLTKMVLNVGHCFLYICSLFLLIQHWHFLQGSRERIMGAGDCSHFWESVFYIIVYMTLSFLVSQIFLSSIDNYVVREFFFFFIGVNCFLEVIAGQVILAMWICKQFLYKQKLVMTN